MSNKRRMKKSSYTTVEPPPPASLPADSIHNASGDDNGDFEPDYIEDDDDDIEDDDDQWEYRSYICSDCGRRITYKVRTSTP